ncbi:MAG: carbohydrate ABC transporter permease, partial [Mesorhizobium sp.]
MPGAGKRQRLTLRIAAIPMGLLALSCLYPIFFAVNNALKTRHDYMLDRFGLATQPTLDNFVQAWTRAHLDEYFLNSVIATLGAVILLMVVSSMAGFALASLRFPY